MSANENDDETLFSDLRHMLKEAGERAANQDVGLPVGAVAALGALSMATGVGEMVLLGGAAFLAGRKVANMLFKHTIGQSIVRGVADVADPDCGEEYSEASRSIEAARIERCAVWSRPKEN